MLGVNCLIKGNFFTGDGVNGVTGLGGDDAGIAIGGGGQGGPESQKKSINEF